MEVLRFYFFMIHKTINVFIILNTDHIIFCVLQGVCKKSVWHVGFISN